MTFFSSVLNHSILSLFLSSGSHAESQPTARCVRHRFHHSQLSRRFPRQPADAVGLHRARHAQLHNTFPWSHSSGVPQQWSGGGVPERGQESDQTVPDGSSAGASAGQLQHGAEELWDQQDTSRTHPELQSLCNEEWPSRYSIKNTFIPLELSSRSSHKKAVVSC